MKRLLIPLFFSILLSGCEEESLTDDTSGNMDNDPTEETTYTSYEAEVFEDLSIDDFNEISTPYEEELSALSGARISTSADELAEIIAELFQATMVDVYEDEARGLSVYVVKLLFEDGTVVNIKIVQDIFEILSIEAIVDEGISDEVSADGFISLSAALETAEGLIEGMVVRWEISLEEENTWEFEIHIEGTNGSRYEIELDATTGDVITQKLFENQEDVVEFEEEAQEEKPEISTEISDLVAGFITGEIIHAYAETDAAGQEIWHVLVETSSGSVVVLEVDLANQSLLSATSDEGPFDYEVSFRDNSVSFSSQLQSVEGQLSVEVESWTFGYKESFGLEYWDLTFYATDEYDNLTTVSIHAESGEWIETTTTPSDELLSRLNGYFEGEIIDSYFYSNDNNPYWEAEMATATGVPVKILIYQKDYQILRAWHDDEDTAINYEFNFGSDATVSLSGAMTKAEEELSIVEASVYNWIYYNSLEVEEISYKTIVLTLVDPNEGVYSVWIDVVSGNILKTES